MPLTEELRFDERGLVIDNIRRQVLIDSEPVELTATEYKLLSALAQYPGRA